MEVRVVTDLTTEPVSSAEAKAWCRVTGNSEDSIFTLLIAAARKACEKYCGASFGEKSLTATWVNPEDTELEIPYGPVISVDALYYIDDEGEEERAVLNSDYYVYNNATITFAKFWSSGVKVLRTIRVEYTAGYGHTDTEPLPDDIKLGILQQIATDYLFRENMSTEGVTNLSNATKSKLAPYKRTSWF